MKKEFRLEKLLEIRIMDERSAAAKLSEIDAGLNRVQNDLELIKKKEAQLYASIVDSIRTPGKLAALQAHLAELKEEAMNLEKILENIKKENLAALAYYCQSLRKGRTELSIRMARSS